MCYTDCSEAERSTARQSFVGFADVSLETRCFRSFKSVRQDLELQRFFFWLCGEWFQRENATSFYLHRVDLQRASHLVCLSKPSCEQESMLRRRTEALSCTFWHVVSICCASRNGWSWRWCAPGGFAPPSPLSRRLSVQLVERRRRKGGKFWRAARISRGCGRRTRQSRQRKHSTLKENGCDTSPAVTCPDGGIAAPVRPFAQPSATSVLQEILRREIRVAFSFCEICGAQTKMFFISKLSLLLQRSVFASSFHAVLQVGVVFVAWRSE